MKTPKAYKEIDCQSLFNKKLTPNIIILRASEWKDSLLTGDQIYILYVDKIGIPTIPKSYFISLWCPISLVDKLPKKYHLNIINDSVSFEKFNEYIRNVWQ